MASFQVLRLRPALRQFLLVAVVALGAIASTAAVAGPSGRVTIAWHVTISPSWFDPSTAPPQIMPNGVICGGAVDGSNQLGEIVTCHAIVTLPDGPATAAVEAIAPRATTATSRNWRRAGRRRRTWNEAMRTFRAAKWSGNWNGLLRLGCG